MGGSTTGILDVGDFGVGGSSDFTSSIIKGSRGDGSGFSGGSGFGSSVFIAAAGIKFAI